MQATQEFYIRKEGDEDSRGPFTIDQLISLVEAGQVDRATFFYDADAEKWIEIRANDELIDLLFPVKKKLSMKSRLTAPKLEFAHAEPERAITVQEMLAAAGGLTEETRARRDMSGEQATTAMWGMRAMGLMLLISAAGLLVSNMETLTTMEPMQIIASPLVLIGLADLVLAAMLLLEMPQAYNPVRIRAVLGLGFFFVYFLSAAQYVPFAAAIAGSISLYACTFVTLLPRLISLALLGIAGMGGFAYTLLS